jgi:hypothetical protein
MRQDSGVLEVVEMAEITDNTTKRFHQLILGLVGLYILAFSVSYSLDSLALAPQLDARENLDLADAFDEGTLASDPFYRAVLYPYLLSLLHPAEMRPTLGLLLGLCSHFLNGFLVFKLTLRVWKNRNPAVLATVLYLLNPASLFFALQILDITLGTSLFLGGLLLGCSTSRKSIHYLGAGLLLGLAVAMRPHFLPVVLVVPVIVFLFLGNRSWRASLIWISVAGILLSMGAINFYRSGDFKMLPWQGAYNLWAANKPGANGLYFKQSIDVSGRDNNANPTKVESISLYGQAHPDQQPPYSIDKMSTYWREQVFAHVLEHPLQVVQLWLFKGYAVLNSFEQYNNLTFSFHKDRLPLLKYNPLNWGILLILGTIGLFQLFRTRPRTAMGILLIMLAYASTLILFYASARFRLPLVPLMAVLTGGSLGWVRGIRGNPSRIISTIATIALTGTVAYSSINGIRDRATYIQDELLLANANADIGKDGEAAEWAKSVLQKSPDRREAQRIYAVSYFNMRLLQMDVTDAFGTWEDQKGLVTQRPPRDPVQDVILGVYFWKWGQFDEASRIWRDAVAQKREGVQLALACLAASGIEMTVPPKPSPLQEAVDALLNSPSPERISQ